MSLDKEEKKLENVSKDSIEQIEHVGPLDYVKDQFDLSSIEATAASKTAWLIPVVVSIRGLLFGMLSMQPWEMSG
jgi:SP family myo-inositol transporter-like MFS transporter 13